MSNRFAPPTAEELAARGLDVDGNPIKVSDPKPAVKKVVAKEPAKTAAKKGAKG